MSEMNEDAKADELKDEDMAARKKRVREEFAKFLEERAQHKYFGPVGSPGNKD